METLIVIIVCLLIGALFGVGVMIVLNDAGTIDKSLTRARSSLREISLILQNYISQRGQLRKQIKEAKKDIRDLQTSVLGLVNEIELLERCWTSEDILIQSTKYVNADEVMIFGRGSEWIYLYTFPTHENLAHERRQQRYPMKLGMTTRANVVERVEEQIRASTTAISERAILRLAFRVNDAMHIESWMHDKLIQAGHQYPDSVGTEWFNTNPVEVEQLFRSYVLQKSTQSDPVLFSRDQPIFE